MSSKRKWPHWGVGVTVLLWSMGVVLADAKPDVKVRLMESLQVPKAGGTAWVAMPNGKEVAPGDRILYTVELTNAGGSEARLPRAFGPVPAGTAFVPGTATAGAGLTVEYSIDGGKSFSDTPTIQVKGEDGKLRTVPAPVERYTTVRWTWEEPLSPGRQIQVNYQVQVR